MVSAEDAVSLYQRLVYVSTRVWLTGGWGIDALLRRQTRQHKDLDIMILLDDVARVLEAFACQDYPLKELWPENCCTQDTSGVDVPTAFVMEDPAGRQIDVHAIRTDHQGNGIPAWCNEEGLIFRTEDLAGEGSIADIAVLCIAPAMQAICHSGYEIPDFQVRDMELLCQRFGLGDSQGEG